MQARIPRILFVLVLTLTGGEPASAQTPGVSLRLGAGARPLALGEAFSAIASDATAAFWNPAGLAILESSEVSLDYRRIDPALNLDTGSVAFQPWSERPVVLGVSASLLNRAGVPAEDVFGSFSGDSGAYEFAGHLNLAAKLHPRVLFGVAAGGLVSTIGATERAQTWTGSTGILLDAWGNNLGIAVRGLTPKIADATIQVPYMYRVSAGVARSLAPGVLLSVQVDRDRGADPVVAGGTEWRHLTGVALRAGVRHALSDGEQVETYSGGLGYHKDKLRADYAVLIGPDRSPEHVLSIGVQFGRYELPQHASDDPVDTEPWIPPIAHDEASTVTTPAALVTQVQEPDPSQVATSTGRPQHTPEVIPPLSSSQPWEPHRAPAETTITVPPRPRMHTSPSLPPRDRRLLDVAPPRTEVVPPARPETGDRDVQTALSKPPVREQLSEPTRSPSTALDPGDSGRFVVRGGVYLEMDDAALEVARCYRAKLRPRLERRGELYVVVLRRCESRVEAEDWLRRAREAGIQGNIDEE